MDIWVVFIYLSTAHRFYCNDCIARCPQQQALYSKILHVSKMMMLMLISVSIPPITSSSLLFMIGKAILPNELVILFIGLLVYFCLFVLLTFYLSSLLFAAVCYCCCCSSWKLERGQMGLIFNYLYIVVHDF